MRGSILPPHRIRPTRLPAKALRLFQHRGKARGARALRHGLLQGQVGVDRPFEMRSRRPARCRTHARGRSATSACRHSSPRCLRRASAPPQGWSSPCKAFHIDGIERGLDADDLDVRLDRFRRDRIAGDQPAAADRNHQHIEIGCVVEHFERDRALSGNDARIIVRMDEMRLRSRLQAPRRAPAPRRRFHRAAPPRRHSALVAAIFTKGVVTGITMVAAMPSRAA